MNKILNVYLRRKRYRLSYTNDVVKHLPSSAAHFHTISHHALYICNDIIYIKRMSQDSTISIVELI
jgi:hypothetical protein